MKDALPQSVIDFRSKYPQIWEAFSSFAEKCHETGGPLDAKTRRLIKLGIAVGARHEGAVHSATRQALSIGVPPDELFHAVILAMTTIGWPAAYAAMTWINDVLGGAETEKSARAQITTSD